MKSKIPHYTIVGGGLSGLCTAYFLSLLKPLGTYRISLFEKSSRWGGLIKTYKNPNTGNLSELGPHSVRATSPTSKLLLRLVADLNLQDRLIWMHSGSKAINQYIYVNGKHVPISFWGIAPNQPFTRSPLKLMLRRTLSRRPCVESDLSVDEFLRSRLDGEFADYYGSAMMRGIYGGDSKKLSAKACLGSFIEMENRGPNFVLGLLRSIISPIPDKPIISSLDAVLSNPQNLIPPKSIVWNLSTGLQTLIDALVNKLSSLSPYVQLNLNSSVEKLVCRGDGIETQLIVENNLDGLSTTHEVNCTDDAIFFSCPSFHTHKILKDSFHSEGLKYLDKFHIPWSSLLSIHIELDNAPNPPVLGFGHLVPIKEDPHILGVLYDSVVFPQMDQARNCKRFTIFTNLIPFSFDKNYNLTEQTNFSNIQMIVNRVLNHHLKIDNPVIVDCKVQLHLESIPQYSQGHLDRLKQIRSEIEYGFKFNMTKSLGMHLIGLSYDGVGLGDVVYSAMTAVSNQLEREL